MFSISSSARRGIVHRLRAVGLCVLLAPIWTSAVRADEVTQAMDVRLEILPSCTLNTPTVDLQFGSQVTYGSPTNQLIQAQSSELQLTCSEGYDWGADFDMGQNASGAQRRLFNAAANRFIPYDLYISYVGGSFLTPTNQPFQGTGTGTMSRLVFTGQIPASTDLGAAGVYRDTVVITFNF